MKKRLKILQSDWEVKNAQVTFLLSPNTGQSFDRYVQCFLETSPITLESVNPELILVLILELTALNGHDGHFSEAGFS